MFSLVEISAQKRSLWKRPSFMFLFCTISFLSACFVALRDWTQSDAFGPNHEITQLNFEDRINLRKHFSMFANVVTVADLRPISCNAAISHWASPKSYAPVAFSCWSFSIIGDVLVFWKHKRPKRSDLIISYCLYKKYWLASLWRQFAHSHFRGLYVSCSPSAALQCVEWSVKWVSVSLIWHHGFRQTFKWYS